jgi:replicative DNA helicase
MGIKTGIKSFDRMIGDGYVSKTLHSILAASGIGKSASLVSFACNFDRQGHDVVILSLEMSESEFYKRIYANLLHIKIQDIPNTPKSNFKMLIQKIKPGLGKIIVKEFPAGSLSPLGVDSFLTKIKNERGIDKPIVMVDYLGIMKSDRMKNSDNSYTYYGSVAEELRAVAQKRNIVIFSPLQLNRGAVNNLEADQSNLSESMRIFMSLDSAFIIAQTQEMKETSEMKIIFVKNRMSGKTRAFDIFYDYEFFEFADKNYDEDLDENITEHNVQKDDINQFTNEIDSLLSV